MALRRWAGIGGAVMLGVWAAALVLAAGGRARAAEAAPAALGSAVLAGRVTDAQSSQPVSQVSVTAYDAVSLADLGSTQTDPQGFYTLPVTTPYGVVKLRFFSELRYPAVWYLDQNGLAAATPLTLSAPTLAGLNVALQRAGTFSLSLTVGGSPLAAFDFVTVQAFDAAGHFAGDFVRAGGGFYLGLRPGGYRLRYGGTVAVPQWQGGAAGFTATVPLTVTAGATTTLAVDLAPGGVITGRVTDALSGLPLDLANIDVFDEAGFWLEDPSFAYADASGVYTVGGLATGGYRLRFTAENHALRYLGGAGDLGTAALVTVTAGQVRGGADVALAPLGVISGALTIAGAPPAAPGFVEVTAYRPGTLVVVARTANQEGGMYVLRVPSGTVELRFSGPGFVPEWYQDQPIQPVATAVSVAAGQVHANINADLPPAVGCLSSTVSGPGGPLTGAYVFLRDAANERLGPAGVNGGGYQLCGLAPGQYHAQFAAYPYAIEWYADRATAAAADLVVVPAAQTTTVNALLDTLGGCLVGEARGPAGVGEPAARRRLLVLNSAGEVQTLYSRVVHAPEQVAAPEADGSFALCGLPPGAYTVVFWQEHDLDDRPGPGEPFGLGGATLTAEAPVAALHLGLPARRIYVPWLAH